MSAASASGVIGVASPSAGPDILSSSRQSARKRSIGGSKVAPDVDLDVPLLTRGRLSRRSKNAAASAAIADAGPDLAFLSHPKDLTHLTHAPHFGGAQLTAEDQQNNFMSTVTTNGKESPLRQKTSKPTLQLAHNVSRRRRSSFLDLIGPLFSRIFLFLVVGAGLASSLWSWKTQPLASEGTSIISTEIDKLEEFMARTAKWMQVRLQVIDLKIDHEVADVRKEMHREMNSQHAQTTETVNDFKKKIEKVSSTLDVLFSQGGPLSKAEALQLVKEVVNRRAAEGQGHALTLDDVRTAARQVLARELERHSADGIGRVDYALGSGGGQVIAHSEGYFLGRRADWWNVIGLFPGANRKHVQAEKVLQPSFGEPGQCLPLKGSNVWVDISLRTTIRPEAVTLEHISQETAYDISSAPKEFRMYGWLQPPRQADRLQNPVTMVPLGDFMYDIDKPGVQTFPLANNFVTTVLINAVRVHVFSNHGSPGHTCLYRIRVHGSEASVSKSE